MKRLPISNLASKIKAAIEVQKYRFFAKPITEARFLKNFSGANENRHDFVERFKQEVRGRFFLSDLNRKEFYVNLMTSIGEFDSILDDADMVHENKFRWLKYGLFSFGEKIDWHLDVVSGRKWPFSFYTKIGISEKNDLSDKRIPWELSRFHQAVWLGRAYWISHSETHAEKFKSLVSDWLDDNPVPCGINWVSHEEVSIRVVNLVIGLMHFIGAKSLDDDFMMRLLCLLYDHGVYLQRNLFAKHSKRIGILPADDQLISSLVGLLFLGIFFSDAEFGKRWAAFARDMLEHEIRTQVCEEGVFIEKSLNRHGFLVELLTIAFVVLRLNGFEVSRFFIDRLEKMFELLSAATMPNGKAPAVGGPGGERVFRLKSETDMSDHRDLLAVGAVLFNRSELKHVAGSFSGLALLLLGAAGFEKFSSLVAEDSTKSMIFKESGIAFLKTERDFCSFRFGGTGANNLGSYGFLSFTISGKEPFIVESNANKFAGNPETQQCSVNSYNTVIIDGVDPSTFAGSRSGSKDRFIPNLLDWNSGDAQDVIEARSLEREYLGQTVSHRRKITFNKKQRTFLIEDTFEGRGAHEIEMLFHFSPDVKVVETERNYLALEGDEFALMKFRYPFTLEDWEYCGGYGTTSKAKRARMRIGFRVPLKIETFIFILSNLEEVHHIFNRLK